MKTFLSLFITLISLSTHSASTDKVNGEVNFFVEGKLQSEIQNTCENFAYLIEDNLKTVGHTLDSSRFDIRYLEKEVKTRDSEVVEVSATCNIRW